MRPGAGLDVLDPVVRAQAQGIEDMAFAVLLAVFFPLGAGAARPPERWLAGGGAGGFGPVRPGGRNHGRQRQPGVFVQRPGVLLKALVRWLGWAVLLYFGLRAVFAGLDRLALPHPGTAGGTRLAAPGRAQNRAVQPGAAPGLLAAVLHRPVPGGFQHGYLVAAGTNRRPAGAECRASARHTYLQSGLLLAGKKSAGQLERRGVFGGAGAKALRWP